MRKFALLAFAVSLLLPALVQLASAQYGDFMVGGNELETLTKRSDVATFQPLQEKNGFYTSIAADIFPSKLAAKYHFGINVESAWRYHQGDYYGYERYRPFLTDVNAVHQVTVTRKVGVDLFAGIGVASNRFDLLSPCNIPGCINFVSSNHFLEDMGFGVRYRFWRRFYVRPELHYYHIQGNQGFNSDNVFRGGISFGYLFGNRPEPRPRATPAPTPAPASAPK